jgi:putative Mg2+ transporter-C (MgtC) family protein
LSTAIALGSYEFLLRLLLAVVLGGLIGLEREFHGRAAGLRTQIIVCLGSTTIMIASMQLYELYANLTSDSSTIRIDPGRIAAGIITGIGFLGAGVILHSDNMVRGLTTAACVWFVAGVGVAIGMGLYVLAVEATVLALLVLFALKQVGRYIQPDYYKKLRITFTRQPGLLANLRVICQHQKAVIKDYEILENVAKNLTTIVLRVKFKWDDDMGEALVEEFTRLEGIRYVHWK